MKYKILALLKKTKIPFLQIALGSGVIFCLVVTLPQLLNLGKVFSEVKELTALLGYRDEQCKLEWIPAGAGELFVEKVEQFIADLNGSKINVP